MNADIAVIWVERLRNGNVKQVRGMLATASGARCCLGVLCDIYMQETGKGEWVGGSVLRFNGMEMFMLPDEVCHWAGVKDRTGDSPEIDLPLSAMNDSECSFAEIADVIEAKYQSL